MAQVTLLNVREKINAKAAKATKNPCTRLCDLIPFLVCPCSLHGIVELLSGNVHIWVLSLFSITGLWGLFYAHYFGWNSTTMDAMIALAFIGPLWVTCTIAPKVQLSGVKGEVMTDIDHLQRTNRKIGKKLKNYRKNIAILQKATKEMTKERRLQRTTVKKAEGISKRLKKERKIIGDNVVKFSKNVKNLENWGKSLPIMIQDFESRVDMWLIDQDQLQNADEDIVDSQQVTENLTKKLKHIPERLVVIGVKPMEYIEEWYSSAANISKEVGFLVLQMQEEYNRFADLVSSQELSFCRNLVYEITENSVDNRFGNEQYNLFLDRLPTYLADVVLADHLRFRKYTTSLVGFNKVIGQAGLRRLIEDIVDGVQKRDQLRSDFLMPDEGGINDLSKFVKKSSSSFKRLFG